MTKRVSLFIIFFDIQFYNNDLYSDFCIFNSNFLSLLKSYYMKRICFSLFVGLFFPTFLHAQNTYTWKAENITVLSSVKLESYDSQYGLTLEGDGINFTLSRLGKMEGITGLLGSLESLAQSYNFASTGKAKSLLGTYNLKAVRIDANDKGKSIILCMYATNDYKKHYMSEVYFPENKRSIAEQLVKNVSYNGGESGNTDENTVQNKEEDQQVNNESENTPTEMTELSNAVDFSLNSIDGQKIKFSSFLGKTVLLDFWGTWCAPCIKEIPNLKKLYDDNKGKNFEIISIASDNDIEKWKRTVTTKSMTWTNLIDPDDKTIGLYSIKAFPTLILVDKKGKILKREITIGEVEDYLQKSEAEVSGEESGDKSESKSLAKDFSLTDINNRKVTLSKLRGKNILLDFWGTWCAPCIKAIPNLVALYDKYGGNNFEIISVASDTDFEKWKNTVISKGMKWTNVIDVEDEIVKLYGIKSFPTLILIDKEGRIQAENTSESEVEEFLDRSTEETSGTVENNTALQTGVQIPDFSLRSIDGEQVSLSSLRGKYILLDFWGTWCKPCLESIPNLKALYEKIGGDNFEIVSVANDNNIEKWQTVVTSKGMTWTNLIDIDEKVNKRFNIKAYPTLILVNKQGKIQTFNPSDDEIEAFVGSSEKNDTQSTYKSTTTNSDSNTDFTTTNTHHDGTPVEKTVWNLLSKYSPDGYTILDEYYKAPSDYGGQTVSGDDDFTKWLDGDSEREIVKSMNTLVHEMDHGYNGRVYLKLLKDEGLSVESGDYSSFYLGNREAKLVKHTDIFITKEINSIFPQKLITGRYETYVYPSEEIMGSQKEGVYGLLDELNAYYNGTKTAFDFYDYYKEKNNTPEGWSEYLSDFHGTYYAYLEFKTYILVYMLYAKEHYNNIYQGILANEDFLYALKKTDERWATLILNFKDLKKKIIADLQSQGVDASESGGYIFFGTKGTGTFSETYNLFQDELKDSRYQAIARQMGLETATGPDL